MAKIIMEFDSEMPHHEVSLSLKKILKNRAGLNDCECGSGYKWKDECNSKSYITVKKISYNNFEVQYHES